MNSTQATAHKKKFGDVAAAANKLLNVNCQIILAKRQLIIPKALKLGTKMWGYIDHVCDAYNLNWVRSDK